MCEIHLINSNSKKEWDETSFKQQILQNRRNSICMYSQPKSLMLKTNQTRSWLASILIEENSHQDIIVTYKEERNLRGGFISGFQGGLID